MHPRFELPPPPTEAQKEQMGKRPPICHYCGELGHKANSCLKLPPEQREAQLRQDEMKYKQMQMMKQQPYNHHIQQRLQGQMLNDENGSANNPPPNQPFNNHPNQFNPTMPPPVRVQRPLEEITCFKCGNKGHYANRCVKGHLAFLSANANQMHNPMRRPPPPNQQGHQVIIANIFTRTSDFHHGLSDSLLDAF